MAIITLSRIYSPNHPPTTAVNHSKKWYYTMSCPKWVICSDVGWLQWAVNTKTPTTIIIITIIQRRRPPIWEHRICCKNVSPTCIVRVPNTVDWNCGWDIYHPASCRAWRTPYFISVSPIVSHNSHPRYFIDASSLDISKRLPKLMNF